MMKVETLNGPIIRITSIFFLFMHQNTKPKISIPEMVDATRPATSFFFLFEPWIDPETGDGKKFNHFAKNFCYQILASVLSAPYCRESWPSIVSVPLVKR